MSADKAIINHVSDFLEFCEVEKGLSSASVKNYHLYLKNFTAWLRGVQIADLDPTKLDRQHIWDYRLYLSRKRSHKTDGNLNKNTQYRYLSALRSLFKYFTIDQLKKFLETPDTKTHAGLRDRAIIEVFFSTGMRVGEIVKLNRKQFNVPYLKQNQIQHLELSIKGKGGKIRNIYFSKRALLWLIQYLENRTENSDALFASLSNNKKKDAALDRR